MVIPSLLSIHSYHADMLLLCFYSFESYLCLLFLCTFWEVGQYILHTYSYRLPTPAPLPCPPAPWHEKTPTVTREISTRISQKSTQVSKFLLYTYDDND